MILYKTADDIARMQEAGALLAQVFADVRTYWSPESIKRVTGYEPTGPAAGGCWPYLLLP